MVKRLSIFLFVLVFACLSGRRASAQHSAAQKLAAGDDAAPVQLAEAAIFAGALKPEQWAELQFTLGVARARAGDAERARRAFIAALALDPNLRLPTNETIDVRSPFMEARGFWSQHAERLSASAELSDDRKALLVSLVDPAALVARLVVRARSAGQGRFVETALPTESTVMVSLEALPVAAGVEYTLALIDENANRLWQAGTDAAPLRVGALEPKLTAAPVTPAPKAAHTAPASAPAAAAKPVSARPYYVGAAVSLIVSAAAFAVAGVNHVQRQDLAAQWNSGQCDGDGTTRGEVCADEHDELKQKQRIAIASYAVGGAGLLAGIVTLILAPSRSERRATSAVRCQSGPGTLGVACGTKF